jgi:hypothetical protein
MNEGPIPAVEKNIPAIKTEILEKVIDIQKYEGIVQYTQVPNVESLLLHDVEASGSRRWGSKGRMTKGRMGSFTINLTTKNGERTFLEWDKLSNSDQGQIAILFDLSILEQNGIRLQTIGFDPDGSAYIEENEWGYEDIQQLIDTGCDHFVVDGQVIPKEAIIGLVLSPHEGSLERRRRAIDRDETENIMSISHDQAVTLLTKRMERQLALNSDSAHFVPLYDYNGDVLWPEKVSHDSLNVG